uniref:ALIX_LYPXL_bnd domain-containing protein n=1 Tax=Caenorhabditis japonica TaxID=281687 RepID=A0A8R1ITV2_CAEJA
MAENQLINEEHISKEKIGQLFGDLKRRVQSSLDRQESLMNQIQTANNQFTGEKSGSSAGAERERILKMLAQAADAYAELKANLEEGTKFYNDLTPILVRLQQKVSDFAFARQTEKEDLMRQLQLSIVSGQATKAVVDGVTNLVSSYFSSGTNSVTPSTPTAGAPAVPPRPPPPRPAAAAPSVESPIPPPRNVQPFQATPGAMPPPQQQQAGYNPYQQTPPVQQFQQHPGYYQQPVPYGQPQPQAMYQPHYQPTFAAPYPTFPGAFPSYQQQQQWPQQQQQQGNFPPNPQFGQQQGGTNPFQ